MSPVSAFCLAQCQDSCNKWQPEWSLPLVTVTEGENNRHFLSLLVFKMKFDILHQSKKKSKSAPLFPHSRSLTKAVSSVYLIKSLPKQDIQLLPFVHHLYNPPSAALIEKNWAIIDMGWVTVPPILLLLTVVHGHCLASCAYPLYNCHCVIGIFVLPLKPCCTGTLNLWKKKAGNPQDLTMIGYTEKPVY